VREGLQEGGKGKGRGGRCRNGMVYDSLTTCSIFKSCSPAWPGADLQKSCARQNCARCLSFLLSQLPPSILPVPRLQYNLFNGRKLIGSGDVSEDGKGEKSVHVQKLGRSSDILESSNACALECAAVSPAPDSGPLDLYPAEHPQSFKSVAIKCANRSSLFCNLLMSHCCNFNSFLHFLLHLAESPS
jgi:hypothetical protein